MSAEDAVGLIRAGGPGSLEKAVRLLEAAAGDGEAEAHRRLASLAAAGIGVRQDWNRALEHLTIAAEGGSPSARGQLHALAPSVAEGQSETWSTLADTILAQGLNPPLEKRVLNTAPRAVSVPGFLCKPVCVWLTGLARGRTRPAMTFATDATTPSLDNARTNTAFEFSFVDSDVVVMLTRQRIAAAIGVPAAALESSQILHYAPGESYRPHFDFIDPAHPGVAAHGQRIVTFLIYLNADFDGGETDFPRLNLRHRGEIGGALYFANLDADGAPDPRTLHAGLPPTRGEKWLFSQWVRNRAWG